MNINSTDHCRIEESGHVLSKCACHQWFGDQLDGRGGHRQHAKKSKKGMPGVMVNEDDNGSLKHTIEIN